MVDVLVAGSGPAGRSVAGACRARGLEVALVAPRAGLPWRSTYGLWRDEAGSLPHVAASVWAGGGRIGREYAVLDNAAAALAMTSNGVRVVRDAVVGVEFARSGGQVWLRSGRAMRAAVVIDASGFRRVLTGGVAPGRRAEQAAFGVVVETGEAQAFLAGREAVFMDDWDVADGVATFVYAVPLPGGAVLIEETSLAARPAVGAPLLRERLARRLRAVGLLGPGAGIEDRWAVERVRFPMDLPARAGRGAVAFGAAAGMVHPATGYSVGAAFSTAPLVADAIAASLPDASAAVAAARQVIWPARARAVHALRRKGLRSLLALPAVRVPDFFDQFFALPAELQRAFLTGRTDLAGTAAAMRSVFAAAPWRLRRSLLLS